MKNVILQEEVFNQSKRRDILFSEWKERFNQLISKTSTNHKISNKEKIEMASF